MSDPTKPSGMSKERLLKLDAYFVTHALDGLHSEARELIREYRRLQSEVSALTRELQESRVAKHNLGLELATVHEQRLGAETDANLLREKVEALTRERDELKAVPVVVERQLVDAVQTARAERDELRTRITELEGVLKEYAKDGNWGDGQYGKKFIWRRTSTEDGPSLAKSVLKEGQ